MASQSRMPAVFLGHGSPMNTLAHNQYTEAWSQLGAAMPRPSAILAVSAHWYLPGTAITAMQTPRTIHDFGGFPQALFDFQYPAPGGPALAQRVREILAPLAVRAGLRLGIALQRCRARPIAATRPCAAGGLSEARQRRAPVGADRGTFSAAALYHGAAGRKRIHQGGGRWYPERVDQHAVGRGWKSRMNGPRPRRDER